MRRLIFDLFYLLKRPPWDTGIPAPELVRVVASQPPGNALDLGCGTGTNVRYLVEHGWRATGVDFVPRAIRAAGRKLKGRETQAQLLVGDVTQLDRLPLRGPYDLALDMGCLQSLPEASRAAYEAGVAGCLRPGGLYMLYAWQPGSDGGRGIPRAEVEALFGRHFRLVNYEQGQGRPSAWYYFKTEGEGRKTAER